MVFGGEYSQTLSLLVLTIFQFREGDESVPFEYLTHVHSTEASSDHNQDHEPTLGKA